MRIALITVNYPPMRSSTAVQMRDLAIEFAVQGHHPTVMVPDPDLRAPWAIEHHDGVEVLRVRTPHHRNIGYVRRAFTEATLPWRMLWGLNRSALAGEEWDGVVWWSPTIFFGPLVNAFKKRGGGRSYMVLRDIFPDWALDLGLLKPGLVHRFFKLIERQQHDAADVVGVQSPSNLEFVEQLRSRPGIRLEVLWNWITPSPDVGCRIDISGSALAGRSIIAYTGNLGVAQNLEVVVELATRWRDRGDIGFLFVGRGTELPRLRATAAERRLTNVLFFDEIESREIPGLLAQCHIGFLALDLRHRTHNIPGKFLAYVGAGLPVLARVNPRNDLIGLIEGHGVGRVDHEATVDSLERVAEEMLVDKAGRQRMGENGRQLARSLFSTSTAVRQIVAGLTGSH